MQSDGQQRRHKYLVFIAGTGIPVHQLPSGGQPRVDPQTKRDHQPHPALDRHERTRVGHLSGRLQLPHLDGEG